MGNYNPCVDIRAASHAMRRRFDSLDIGKPSGLTPSQKDIEAEFNIRRSTATRLLQSMEHKDLIMREPEENDGRLKRIRLTEKAAERSREVLDRISCIERQLVEGITAEEMKVLHSVCQRIRQNAERTGGDK